MVFSLAMLVWTGRHNMGPLSFINVVIFLLLLLTVIPSLLLSVQLHYHADYPSSWLFNGGIMGSLPAGIFTLIIKIQSQWYLLIQIWLALREGRAEKLNCRSNWIRFHVLYNLQVHAREWTFTDLEKKAEISKLKELVSSDPNPFASFYLKNWIILFVNIIYLLERGAKV